MNDIDFDELDRAVSSALSTPAAEDASKPVQAPVASTVPERAVQPPAQRRGGRFMDVVHPSSDMRSGSPTPTEKQSDLPSTPADSSAEMQPTPPVLTENAQETTDEPSSLGTPFVTGAKVEKRPLGGPTPTSSLDDALAQLNMSDEHTPLTESVEAVTDVPEPLETSSNETTFIPAPTLEDTEAEALGESETIVPALEEASEPAESAQANAAQSSIVQQYTEHAPSSEPEQTGAIFDTESYHQPVVHAEKKHSAWLIVLWIVGLLVLGGGLGAAAYFFLLPLL